MSSPAAPSYTTARPERRRLPPAVASEAGVRTRGARGTPTDGSGPRACVAGLPGLTEGQTPARARQILCWLGHSPRDGEKEPSSLNCWIRPQSCHGDTSPSVSSSNDSRPCRVAAPTQPQCLATPDGGGTPGGHGVCPHTTPSSTGPDGAGPNGDAQIHAGPHGRGAGNERTAQRHRHVTRSATAGCWVR